jgi:2-polyprenyl-3-methyl-5-hydroxy-6-metoxy-1,4-benzoquinol methylase
MVATQRAAYNERYFEGQQRKSAAKVAWQYGRLLRAIGKLPARARVLDLGCGAGPALPLLVAQGYDVWGSDFVRYPLGIARRVAPAARLVCADAQEALPFADAQFDAVLLSEVIEHVRDPQALVRQLWRVLRPGGALALTTPNTWDVRRAYYPALGRVWSGDADPTHVELFSPRSMAALLRGAGFARVWVRSGFKPMRFLKAGPLRAEIPYPPLIGNTLLAVARR